MTPPLLLIEDTASLQLVYESTLTSAGHDVVSVSTAAEGYEHLVKLKPQVVLLDLMLPDRDGLELMKDCLSIHSDTRFIVITANASINRAVAAMRAGAFEFLVKPFDENRFLNAVDIALKEANAAAAPEPDTAAPNSIEGFIGSSEPMQQVYAKIRSVSKSMATVFVTGESGTGKEVCAQAVHATSTRSKGPLIPLNCGAIPADLLESEVFGHLKGSFTGAIADKPGAAAAADGGTLFLDEICEMDLNLQTKLLRFIQTSSIMPVGATKPSKVSVRIICATNRDPKEEVRRGRFREDLYYRLHVVPIHLPALRERGDDVLEIAQHALMQFSSEEGRTFKGLSEDVQNLFRHMSWPGNVRQVLNVLRNVVVLNDGQIVTKSMLPIELHHEIEFNANGLQELNSAPQLSLSGIIGKSLAEIERLVIEETIAQHGGSVPKAARVLDVSPSTLYRKREGWAGITEKIG